ncbi:unnamed protein product [Calypogeia fissa]
MSSSVDPLALNLKHQKTAASKKNEGASFFSLENHETFGQYEAEDKIKDSQDEVSGFHQGGLQLVNFGDRRNWFATKNESSRHTDVLNEMVSSSQRPPVVAGILAHQVVVRSRV